MTSNTCVVELSAEEISHVSGGTFLLGHVLQGVVAVKSAKIGLGLAAVHAVKGVVHGGVSFFAGHLGSKWPSASPHCPDNLSA